MPEAVQKGNNDKRSKRRRRMRKFKCHSTLYPSRESRPVLWFNSYGTVNAVSRNSGYVPIICLLFFVELGCVTASWRVYTAFLCH